MAGIELKLQREVFEPQREQLLAMVHCVSEKKGRIRDSVVCLVNNSSSTSAAAPFRFHILITELRFSGPAAAATTATDAPKRKHTWPISELKAIDAKFSAQQQQPNSDFVLEFDKAFTYTAVNAEERKKFLSTLINLSVRHNRKQSLQILNLPPDVVVVDEALMNGSDVNVQRGYDVEQADAAYEAISTKEATDLLTLMQKCEHAVTNADIFLEDLNRELSILDGANIYSIMASEENIDKLMEMLEGAISHTEALESRLNQYDDLLEHIRDSMDKMEGKTVSIETVNFNNKKLLDCLENLTSQLDLPHKYVSALNDPDFSQPKKLRDCIMAAKALQKVLTAEIDPNLVKLSAVQGQQKRCEKLRDKLAKTIHRYLSNLFIHLGNDTSNIDAGTTQLKLSRRKHIHKELMKYAELVHWLKAMDAKGFESLQSTYRQNLCKLYEKDIGRFFELARFQISGTRSDRADRSAGSTADLSGGKKGSRILGGGLLGTDNDSISSEISMSERERFDDVMETVLIELEDVCMDEQFFSIHFFEMEQVDAANPDAKRDKRVMEAARGMMAEIFPSLENELLHFISFYERADSFFTLHALVRLSKHVLSTQDTGSFLAISFGTVLVQVKRNFDKFMQLQVKSIEESRAPRKPKCGILSFIANFETFVNNTESIFKNSERRSDLEKWYNTLVVEMFSAIVRVSREHGKTPSEVVKMENFHHLHALLAQMKIAALEPLKKDTKQKYNDALSAYVTQYFGRPLEKLNVFFEGIQQLVAAGVKESEIGYQLAYSKQELRKVIAIYPGREVKRGLEALYKKVERHLSEEESLNQVVWRAMQEEFITQYKNIEDLIQRCYPGAQITLDFTINEILEYFSEIARSH